MDLVASNMRRINHKRWHLISISCPDRTSKPNALVNEKTKGVLEFQGCQKILSLQFDDLRDDQVEFCLKNGFKPVLFTKEQAKQVVDFIKELQMESENSDLIIHCDAGISRSGAVAKFTSDFLKIPFLDPYIRPNTYVLRLLWEVIDERNATEKFKNFIMV
jgi:predicted protein tyrosine phosphatase